MKYIIDMPRNLLEEIRKILKRGEYNNINELVITSLENQISLESGEKIEEDLFSTVIRMPKTMIVREKIAAYNQKNHTNYLSIKEIKNIKTFPPPDIKQLQFPDKDYNTSWLWGQINRIFPIKVGLRILLNMQNEKKDYINLNDFQIKAGEVAKEFGQKLLEVDNELKRKRDKKVSTALPIGDKEEKAIARYTTQFLAIKRKNGILDGAMTRLKFVNIKQIKKENFIGLTNEGLEFTKLENPIIDLNHYSEKTLSDEEVNFYIKHIKKYVPEELNPLKTILKIISNGVTSVTEIDKEIKKIKPEWTDIIITTQRSGTLGRLNELRMLIKEKKGVEVIYTISDNGKRF